MPNTRATIIVPYIIPSTLGRGEGFGPVDDVGVEFGLSLWTVGGFVANAP